MAQTVIRDNRGITLIEVLISFLLVMVTSLALIQSSLVAMNTNVINELRNEAVKVAELKMDELRQTPFPAVGATNALTALPPPGAVDSVITRKVRATSCGFTPSWMVKDIGVDDIGQANLKQINLTITWTYKNVNYQYNVSTVVRRQS
jgi:Tfp pilus assembly protein PilV